MGPLLLETESISPDYLLALYSLGIKSKNLIVMPEGHYLVNIPDTWKIKDKSPDSDTVRTELWVHNILVGMVTGRKWPFQKVTLSLNLKDCRRAICETTFQN